MTDRWTLDRKRTDKTLAALRADPLWIELTKANGPIEFMGSYTSDVYRVTTWGCMQYVRNDAPLVRVYHVPLIPDPNFILTEDGWQLR